MTTPPPIAFEPAAKPAPARRDTGAGDAHSFADTMQAQRANDRATPAGGPVADGRAQARPADAAQPTPADRSAAQANTGHQGGNTGPNQGTAAASADKAASAPGQTKADGTPAAGRGSDQGAAKAAEAAAKSAGAADVSAKTANADVTAALSRAAAAAKAAPQAGPTAAQARGTTIDGQRVNAVVQDIRPGQARPVNAATALAAHTATAVSGSAGNGETAAKTSQTDGAGASKTGTSTANVGDRTDPTAKALKEALTGQADGRGARSGEEAADARGQRTDNRTGGQRTAAAGMNPALRAAAEAVQQQLSGSAGAQTTGQTTSQTAGQTTGQATAQTAGQSANQAAALTAAPGQTFDPVLQNTGPQPGGAGQPGSLAAAGKAAASAGTGAGNPAPTAPPAEQIAVQMQRAAQQGQSRVQIRLNPAELGRIDVKLDVGDDGHVRAVLAVDKPETLDLMQRDPRALERALQAAGLKTDPGSLSFNLRDDGTGQGGTAGGDGRDRPDGRPGQLTGDPAGDAAIPAESLRASLPADGRVDIRV